MNTKYFIAAALLALPVAANAQSADAAGNFSGPYVGGQIGWGVRAIDESFGIAGVPDFDRSKGGVDYGVYFGFDAPVGTNFVLGAEAEIGGGGKTLRQNLATGITASLEPEWNYMLTGRAGFVAGERALIYARLGYGSEKVDIRVSDTNNAANSFSESEWSDGLVLGAGVEYALAPNTSARLEYRYKDFGGSYTPEQILAGVSFRF